jgi:hypothetical protein
MAARPPVWDPRRFAVPFGDHREAPRPRQPRLEDQMARIAAALEAQSERAQSAADKPAEVCLCPATIEQLAAAITRQMEAAWITTRGMNIRAPSTCQQPVTSSDIDAFRTAVAIPDAMAVGTFTPVARIVATTQQIVVKGMAWTAVVVAPALTDPFTVCRFRLVKSRQQVRVDPSAIPLGNPWETTSTDADSQVLLPYNQMAFASSINLAGLSAVQVLLKRDEVLTLECEKFAASAGAAFTVAGRLKGWGFVSAVEADGVLGTIAW